MVEYPEVENFSAIMMYWDGYGRLFRKADKEEHKDDPEYYKRVCEQMVMYARPAMQETKAYNEQYRKARKENEYREKEYFPVVTAEPFKRLSVIYEKEGNLVQAIYYCQQAISLRLTDDGTQSGMKGRLERLMKKYNSSVKKNTDSED